MTQEALRMALDALEELYDTNSSWWQEVNEQTIKKIKNSIPAIKEALAKEKTLQALHSENERLGLYKDAYAQPEQEPVVWRDRTYGTLMNQEWQNADPLYTHPPQLEERNFCQRCGKRLGGIDSIHTCTPPMENTHDTRG